MHQVVDFAEYNRVIDSDSTLTVKIWPTINPTEKFGLPARIYSRFLRENESKLASRRMVSYLVIHKSYCSEINQSASLLFFQSKQKRALKDGGSLSVR